MTLRVETDGHGADVVLLHGWGLHGGVFERVAAALSTRFCVHRVDLPGHGGSAPLAPFRAEQVADLLAERFPLPAQVVGWSLGGLVAQSWALRHPDLVKSLVLVASSPCFVRKADWPHAQPAQAIEAVAASLDNAFEATLERFLALQMLGAPSARDTLKAVRAQMFSHGRPQGLLPALQLLLEADLRGEVGAIGCPVGLFYGQRDVITPLGAGQWLAEHLPDAALVTFTHASHAPFLSHEAAFVARLTEFLDCHA
ncbi:MAG: pimeloyl-ACP methyl ester esterase BioH [Paludibacterium sp.]|uniref:pimeloyl-ACP methyl ester esterase BioH n=1 Tax=Paludibacterium sp. TaxID=1917523 RepID=UPI0025CE5460|nr:pimeloyl-ACP methyl ester esterase BioH [Paludibacterium sp.]MBV8047407.1 pimeloyl-ACP methyl ester esterase BioH [Paludibacterium sp.]MBV8649358.1 pimeloyl-ACP methyl ester esterase BioH [Paludibacterium sp.]